MRYECDCGKVFSTLVSLEACQATNHGIPRKPEPFKAASIATRQSEDGRIEFAMLDDNGDTIATTTLHPDDLASFISNIVSIGGHDELGRDFALKLQKAS